MEVSKKKNMKNVLSSRYFPAIVGILLLSVLGQVLSSGFLTVNNVSSILMTASLLTLASIAQAFVILSGNTGMDMSVGAIMSMTALFAPMIKVVNPAVSVFVMIPFSLLLGGIVGLINGIGVRFFKIVPLVMTLIVATVVNGFSILITKGQPSVSVSKELQMVSLKIIGPFRLLSIVTIAFLIFMEFWLLRKTKYGKSLMLVGNNPNAALLCGLKINKISVLAYVMSGAISGLAGMLLVGYAGTAQMNMATGYTMLSIASVVIGGTKMSGGSGSLIGGALGALVLVMISTILQALNMPAGLRTFIQGVILLAVLISNNRDPKLRQ